MIVLRLALVTVLLFAFVKLVGTDRVEGAIGATVHAVRAAPGWISDFEDRWDRAERKAQREREKARQG